MRVLVSIFLLLSAGITQAVTQQTSSPVARKVTSYDDQIPGSEDEQWQLEDYLITALSADPSSKAYIIAYGGLGDPSGKALRYAMRAKRYLVDYRAFDPQRIVTIDGGYRDMFVVDLWFVPKDAKAPEPTPTRPTPPDHGDNIFYDQFDIGYDNFALRTENDAVRLERFAATLKNEPKSWGCIIGYGQTGDDNIGIAWDPPGTGLRIARDQRTYLVKNYKLPLSRLSVIDGGYSGRTIELWIMRPQAKFDRGPFIFPSRLRANRNGTLTIGKSYWYEPRRVCVKPNF